MVSYKKMVDLHQQVAFSKARVFCTVLLLTASISSAHVNTRVYNSESAKDCAMMPDQVYLIVNLMIGRAA